MWKLEPRRKMLYITNAIIPLTVHKPSSFSKLRLKSLLGLLNKKIVEGRSAKKNIAGDLVSHAPPRLKPVSMAISSLRVLVVTTPSNIAQIPNIVSILSTRAIRSKNTVKGEIAQKKLANIAVFLDLNKTHVKRKMPITLKIPVHTDTILPAIKGSSNTFKNGTIDHIKSGCLPSVIGKKRKVETDFII